MTVYKQMTIKYGTRLNIESTLYEDGKWPPFIGYCIIDPTYLTYKIISRRN